MAENKLDIRATVKTLTGLIHAAILREAEWREFLQRLQVLLPSGAATLFYHDAAAARGAFSLCAGLSEQALRSYSDRYSSQNPWMEAAVRRPIGLAVPDAAMRPREELKHTAFFNDFMKPHGLRGAIGITVARESSLNFMLSVLGDVEDSSEHGQALAVLRALVPDLRRAFAFQSRAGRAAAWSAAGAEVPVVVLGHDRRVRDASPSAQALLAEGELGCFGPTGRLDLRNARAAEDVDRRLAGACRGDFESPPRVFLTGRLSRTPLKLTVFTPAWDGGSRFFRGPECILVIETPYDASLDLTEVASFFGLTEAETRVARAIAVGMTPAETAAAAGVGLETIRSQLRTIFAKTGVRRQTELARLCITLAQRMG